jgi:diguanylate cyclase (GGDEF)-like protein/PAS domain S-box-containing protein
MAAKLQSRTIAVSRENPVIYSEADLSGFAVSPRLCWVQDIDRARVVWANKSACDAFLASTPEEFYSRDVSPLSEASRTRLETYRQRVAHGNTYVTQWTTFILARQPLTLLANISAYELPDKRLALFFDAVDICASTCTESLRMLESARQSFVFMSMYNMHGCVLEHNAAFLREFGEHSGAPRDDFQAMFESSTEAERIRSAAIAAGEFHGQVKLLVRGQLRWHFLIAISMLDPVNGTRILHVESIDVSSEVEAELRAREAERLLQQVADEMPQPIAYIRANREFGFVNQTFARWTGRSPEKIIGRPLEQIVEKGAMSALANAIPVIEAGDRHYYERLANIHGVGERWVGVDMIPHRNSDGVIAGGFIFGRDIDAQKRAEIGQIQSERQLRLISEALPVAVALFGLDSRLLFANQRFASWFGVSRDNLVGRHGLDIFGEETYRYTQSARERVIAGEPVYFRRQQLNDGELRWIDVNLAPFYGAANEVTGFVAVYADVTKRVTEHQALNATKDALANHLANTPLAVIQLDSTHAITQWTGRATEAFGWTDAQALGRRFADLQIFDSEAGETFDREMEKLRHGTNARFTMQIRSRRRDGTPIHAEWFGSVLRDNNEVKSFFFLVQDVSARVTAEHHLQYVASHDVLTGLTNRAQFQERLKQEVARARRHNHRIAVFLIDLDRFKYVNESLGHNVGDTLLQNVANQLAQLCEDGDLAARAGGDEFILLLELDDDAHMHRIGEQIRGVSAKPMKIGDQDIFVTLSVGVSVFPDDADTDIELVKNADWALYRAKDAGRNTIQFYSRTSGNDAPSRLSIESDLRRVVESGQLELHYQPKQSMVHGRVTGAEALVRWRHPVRGLIQPDQFITLAEETGLIIGIGEWVCREACEQIVRWRNTWGSAPQVAINISPMQLGQRNLADSILGELDRAGLPGSALMVEITETGVVSDPYLASLTLEKLRAHGVQAAIDDFGKGYSSLTQLKRLPIDALKIDSSFVRELVNDRDDAAIVQAIIGLGRSLDLRVVAEGVESPEQMTALLRYGCDEVQGYMISRPIPADDFAAIFLSK